MKKSFYKTQYFKLIIKVAVTATALFFVFRKIPFLETFAVIKNASFHYLLLGFLFFNLSKVIAAFRLEVFYEAIDVTIGKIINLKLYYLGMFYNLFLPGGIGGDGYKVYLLKQNSRSRTKQLITTTLVDRLSGLAALAFLAGIISLPINLPNTWYFTFGKFFLIVASFMTLWLLIHLIFPYLKKVFIKTAFQSLGVQVAQLICAVFILKALGVEGQFFEYLLLFLVSSAVSVLPFTIGGVGARELVFLYGYELLAIEATSALAFTLLFFAITALSSLLGLLFIGQIESQLKKGVYS